MFYLANEPHFPPQVGGGVDSGCDDDHSKASNIAIDASEPENNDVIESPSERFIVTAEGRQYLRRFGVEGWTVSFRIGEPREGKNYALWIEAAISYIHNYITMHVPGNNLIRVNVEANGLHKGPVDSFRHIQNFISNDLWNLISFISQSNEVLVVDDTLIL